MSLLPGPGSSLPVFVWASWMPCQVISTALLHAQAVKRLLQNAASQDASLKEVPGMNIVLPAVSVCFLFQWSALPTGMQVAHDHNVCQCLPLL